ncbi:uncharacterized protein AMSG_04029 [Thecamonas trahens ATCC 50062]|uniref:Spc7 kinetochore protein domain-containing protein n=1 Tax=Thecamonas trahens ATCC 50062 TaxID=461836 RepID=A0A0L0D6T0_THETB|nr:hypothetical protein AMSG_04029 [Thecamonas trahens ATCC 50062]KNC47801.1 hypothetical protein AMSG_04029 [Thecamonas trahens ATCC 50062]|eukprot:XP_013759279.1 hypothetical protein AMSG_04029 [Thecamonas trahens ATCC 50062]
MSLTENAPASPGGGITGMKRELSMDKENSFAPVTPTRASKKRALLPRGAASLNQDPSDKEAAAKPRAKSVGRRSLGAFRPLGASLLEASDPPVAAALAGIRPGRRSLGAFRSHASSLLQGQEARRRPGRRSIGTFGAQTPMQPQQEQPQQPQQEPQPLIEEMVPVEGNARQPQPATELVAAVETLTTANAAFDEVAPATFDSDDDTTSILPGGRAPLLNADGATTGILAVSGARKKARRSLGRRVSFAPTIASVREYEKRHEEWMSPQPESDSDADLSGYGASMHPLGDAPVASFSALESLSTSLASSANTSMSSNLDSMLDSTVSSEGNESMGPLMSLNDLWQADPQESIATPAAAEFSFDSDEVDDDSIELTETFSSKPAYVASSAVASAALLTLTTDERLSTTVDEAAPNPAFDIAPSASLAVDDDDDDSMLSQAGTGQQVFTLSRVPTKNLSQAFEQEALAAAPVSAPSGADSEDDSMEMTETVSADAVAAAFDVDSLQGLDAADDDTMEMTVTVGNVKAEAEVEAEVEAEADADESMEMTTTINADVVSAAATAAAFDATPADNSLDLLDNDTMEMTVAVGNVKAEAGVEADESMEMTTNINADVVSAAATAAAFDATPADNSLDLLDNDTMEMTVAVGNVKAEAEVEAEVEAEADADESMEMTTTINADVVSAAATAAAFDATPADNSLDLLGDDDAMEMTTTVGSEVAQAAFDAAPVPMDVADESMEMTTTVGTVAPLPEPTLSMDEFLVRTSVQLFTQFSTRRPTLLPPPPMPTDDPIALELLSVFVLGPETSIFSFGCTQLEQLTASLHERANALAASLSSDNAPIMKALALAQPGSAEESALVDRVVDLKALAKGRAKVKWYAWLAKLNGKLAAGYSRSSQLLEGDLAILARAAGVCETSRDLASLYDSKINTLTNLHKASELAALRTELAAATSANSQAAAGVAHLEATKGLAEDGLRGLALKRNALKRAAARAAASAAGCETSYEAVEALSETLAIVRGLSDWSLKAFKADASIALTFGSEFSVALQLQPSPAGRTLLTGTSAAVLPEANVFVAPLFDAIGIDAMLYMDAPLPYDGPAVRAILDDLELHFGRVMLLSRQLAQLAALFDISYEPLPGTGDSAGSSSQALCLRFNSLRSSTRFAVYLPNLHHDHLVAGPVLDARVVIEAAPHTPIAEATVLAAIAAISPSLTRLRSLVLALDAL